MTFDLDKHYTANRSPSVSKEPSAARGGSRLSHANNPHSGSYSPRECMSCGDERMPAPRIHNGLTLFLCTDCHAEMKRSGM